MKKEDFENFNNFIHSVESKITDYAGINLAKLKNEEGAEQKIQELENRINSLRNIQEREPPNSEIAYLKSEFNQVDPENFQREDYYKISDYAEKQKELVNLLDRKTEIDQKVSSLKYSKGYKKMDANDLMGTSRLHYSFFLLQNKNVLFDILNRPIILDFICRFFSKKASRKDVFYLCKIFENDSSYQQLKDKETQCFDHALDTMKKWQKWRDSCISEMEKQTNTLKNDSQNIMDTDIKFLTLLSELEREFPLEKINPFVQQMLEFCNNTNTEPELDIEFPFDTIILAKVQHNFTVGNIAAIRSVLETFLSQYPSIFEFDHSTGRISYLSFPYIRLSDPSFKWYIHTSAGTKNEYKITLFLYQILQKNSPWKIRFLCCGEPGYKMNFITETGGIYEKDTFQMMRMLFDIMQKREKLLGEYSFSEYNRIQLFSSEETIPAIIVFIYDSDDDERSRSQVESLQKRNGEEYLDKIISRGARNGIYLIQISQMPSLFRDCINWSATENGLQPYSGDWEIRFSPSQYADSPFKVPNRYDFYHNYIFPCITLTEKDIITSWRDNGMLCPIGKNSFGENVCIELSERFYLWQITGEPFSGKSNVIHIILETLLKCPKENIHIYLADMQPGGFEYLSDKYIYAEQIKMMIFDTSPDSIYPAIQKLQNIMLELAYEYKTFHVKSSCEYTQKTGKELPQRIFIIDGIQYIPETLQKMIRQLLSEGIRYNIYGILAGEMQYELSNICRSRILTGMKSAGQPFPSTRHGFGCIAKEGKSTVVQFYKQVSDEDRITDKGYISPIICGHCLDNPASLLSAYLQTESICHTDDTVYLDIGNTIMENVIPPLPHGNIPLKFATGHNILMLGGNSQYSKGLITTILYDLVTAKKTSAPDIRIVLLWSADPAAIALAEQFNSLVDIDRIDTNKGETFVLIDDINKRPSSAFRPGLPLPPNASHDSRILKQCLEHHNVHVIMWCSDPANMHPSFTNGKGDISPFCSYFRYRINMHLEGRNDFNASFSEYEECRNLPEDKAWLHVGTQKNLLTLYKPLTPEEKEKLNENIKKVR